MATITRRRFLVGAASASAGAVLAGERALGAGSAIAWRGWQQALNASETRTLVAWCDLLVPGAKRNNVGDFVNDQLVKPPEYALLVLRFFTWQPPYDGFYRQGVASLDAASREIFGRSFASLARDQQAELRDRLLADALPWTAPPPAGLFYTVTRLDGVDVVYGTKRGFERLGYPYMALIDPPAPW